MADPPDSQSHIAHTLLTRAHSPTQATAIFTDKVLHKPLTLRPTSPDPNSQDARAHRRLLRIRKKEHIRRRQKPKPLSAKEKRTLGIYDIPKEEQTYTMWEILGLKEGEKKCLSAPDVGPKLASADYHGAELEVVRSRCVGRVGCKGIVVKDTKFTFEVITKKNFLRSICLIDPPYCSVMLM
jgi:ribonuclease P protein subunit POP4